MTQKLISTKTFIATKIWRVPGFISGVITEKDQKMTTLMRNENSGEILNFFIFVCLLN
jgi:hypothetical protein